MDKTFSLEILTRRKRVFQGPVASLVAPGALGYLGILAHHAPLVAALVPGRVVLREASGQTRVFRSLREGFLQVDRNAAVLLADDIEAESTASGVSEGRAQHVG